MTKPVLSYKLQKLGKHYNESNLLIITLKTENITFFNLQLEIKLEFKNVIMPH